MRSIINSNFFWLLFALPGLGMCLGLASGGPSAEELLHPSGEFSVRFMILAMLVGPLTGLLGRRPWLMWFLTRRRWLGVAAFGYAMLHMVFYMIDKGGMAALLKELPIKGIWSGWLALFIMLPIALTSNDTSMKALRLAWKRVQQLAYPCAVITLLHWLWVSEGAVGAVVHFMPLVVVWAFLLGSSVRARQHQG